MAAFEFNSDCGKFQFGLVDWRSTGGVVQGLRRAVCRSVGYGSQGAEYQLRVSGANAGNGRRRRVIGSTVDIMTMMPGPAAGNRIKGGWGFSRMYRKFTDSSLKVEQQP